MKYFFFFLCLFLILAPASGQQAQDFVGCWKRTDEAKEFGLKSSYRHCDSFIKEVPNIHMSSKVTFKENGDFFYQVSGATDIPKGAKAHWQISRDKKVILITRENGNIFRKFFILENGALLVSELVLKKD